MQRSCLGSTFLIMKGFLQSVLIVKIESPYLEKESEVSSEVVFDSSLALGKTHLRPSEVRLKVFAGSARQSFAKGVH